LGKIPYPYTEEDGKQWLARKKIAHGANGIVFAIHRKEQSGFIGTVSVFNLASSNPEFGFWLGEPYWCNGYMTEAAMRLRDYLFDDLNAPFVLSRHLLNNLESGRVAEKCGLKEDGFEPLWSQHYGKFFPGRRLKLDRQDWETLRP